MAHCQCAPPRPNRVKHFKNVVMFPTVSKPMSTASKSTGRVAQSEHRASSDRGGFSSHQALDGQSWGVRQGEFSAVGFQLNILTNPLIICIVDASYSATLFKGTCLWRTLELGVCSDQHTGKSYLLIIYSGTMNKPQDIPEFLHFILQERRSYIMDAMRIAEQRKEVPVFWKRFLKFLHWMMMFSPRPLLDWWRRALGKESGASGRWRPSSEDLTKPLRKFLKNQSS